MIKAILIFNNHGKPRLSKFYQPYVSIPPPPIRVRGSRWRLAASSGRPPQARRGPSRAPGRLALPGCHPLAGGERGAHLPPRSCPPTWLCSSGSSARLWAGRLPGGAGEALGTSRGGGPSAVGGRQPTRAREPTRRSGLPAARGSGRAERLGLAAPPPRLAASPGRLLSLLLGTDGLLFFPVILSSRRDLGFLRSARRSLWTVSPGCCLPAIGRPV